MRRVFFLLLVINFFFLVWRVVVGLPEKYMAPESGPSAVMPKGVDRVMLIGEPTADKQAVAPVQSACSFVGPFKKAERAKELIERLAAVDVGANLQELASEPRETYWLYLEGSGDRKQSEKSLSDLQKRGIDSYILPKEDDFGISLGLFSEGAAALLRRAELKKDGVEAKIKTVERSTDELWVSVKQREVQKISKKLWEKLIKTQFKLEEKQKTCLDVASK